MEELQKMYPEARQRHRGRPIDSQNRPWQLEPQDFMDDKAASSENPPDEERAYQDDQPVDKEYDEMQVQPIQWRKP